MNRCLVIGGGIAGLTAASVLSSRQVPVTLIESSPKFGGRTYSFRDKVTGQIIDNGQHILMGCYDYTLSFLKLIGAENNFTHQKNLRLIFLDENKGENTIDASSLFYPLNLVLAILKYAALSPYEKLALTGLLIKLPLLSTRTLRYLTVSEWLKNENQSGRIIKNFWEIICTGALNAGVERASALIFHRVLISIFFGGRNSSKIVMPKSGLSESIIEPAVSFINDNGGETLSSAPVHELIIDNNRVKALRSGRTLYKDFDFVISAVPLFSLERIISRKLLDIHAVFLYPTILNIHIWLKNNPLREEFYGLLNSPLHWIFNKGKHLNVVVSDADFLSQISSDEIISTVVGELRKYTGIRTEDITGYKILKEKRATFLSDIRSVSTRPSARTAIKNLFLAGDWTDTGLPATIEGAAKSGYTAAELVLEKYIQH